MLKNFLAIVALVFTAHSYSQDTQSAIKDFERDTLKGKHFNQFIIPKEGTRFDIADNKEAIYFKKCQHFTTKIERTKCFSDNFYEVLRLNLRKIKNRKYKNLEVSLVVKITVNKRGVLEDISFIESNDSSGLFEKEVIRVLKKLPEMVPAQLNGEFVNSSYSLPIIFNKLEK